MFEDLITFLDEQGLAFNETEEGTVIIDIATEDKTVVVDIVAFLNDNAFDYSIDADSVTVFAAPVEEDADVAAEDDLFGGDILGLEGLI